MLDPSAFVALGGSWAGKMSRYQFRWLEGAVIGTPKLGQISLVGAIYQALSANLGCFVFKTNVCVNDVFAQSPMLIMECAQLNVKETAAVISGAK